jgi:hypothetical protein
MNPKHANNPESAAGKSLGSRLFPIVLRLIFYRQRPGKDSRDFCMPPSCEFKRECFFLCDTLAAAHGTTSQFAAR